MGMLDQLREREFSFDGLRFRVRNLSFTDRLEVCEQIRGLGRRVNFQTVMESDEMMVVSAIAAIPPEDLAPVQNRLLRCAMVEEDGEWRDLHTAGTLNRVFADFSPLALYYVLFRIGGNLLTGKGAETLADMLPNRPPPRKTREDEDEED